MNKDFISYFSFGYHPYIHFDNINNINIKTNLTNNIKLNDNLLPYDPI